MVFPLIAAVFSTVASVVATITPVIASIGPAVATFCTTVLPKIVPVLIGSLEKLNTFVNVVQAVLQIMEIFRPGEQLKDIGDRAIQASRQDIKPENFDSFDAYMKEIRAFELDPAQTDKITDADKYAAGLVVGAQGMDEKFNVREGTMANLWPLVANNPEYFTSTRLTSLLKSSVCSNTLKAVLLRPQRQRPKVKLSPPKKPWHLRKLKKPFSRNWMRRLSSSKSLRQSDSHASHVGFGVLRPSIGTVPCLSRNML
jgi:hypothetical protein